jgi:hypothetical protein
LKEKLEFKNKLENFRMIKNPKKDVRWERVDMQYICGLGLKKVQK